MLTVAELLRHKGVVGKFVEFYGAGLASLPLADRATIGNMSPEFGSTCAIFPIDAETLRYLEFTGRPAEQIELVEAYARAQGLWHDADVGGAGLLGRRSSSTSVRSCRRSPGPKRPQDRISLTDAQPAFRAALEGLVPEYDCHDEGVGRELSLERPAGEQRARASPRRTRASASQPRARATASPRAGCAGSATDGAERAPSRSRSRTAPRRRSTMATS